MFNISNTNIFNNFEIDYSIITVYPVLTYVFYVVCRKYYNYILHNNLSILDMYDSTYDNNYIALNEVPT